MGHRLWTEEGRLVAWSWLLGDGSGQLEHDVHPDHLHLLDEILANPAARTAFAFVDDGERRAALARHGFTQPGEPMHYLVRDVPERPEPPPLPTGFRYRTVGPDDVRERVVGPSGRVGTLPPDRGELRTGARAMALS